MTWGLLWYEVNDSLEDKVANAALYYEEKFLAKPNTCFVPADEVKDPITVAGCQVIPDEATLAHHIWMGVAS